MITFLQKSCFFVKNNENDQNLLADRVFSFSKKVLPPESSILDVKNHHETTIWWGFWLVFMKSYFFLKKCKNKFLKIPPLVWSRKCKISYFCHVFSRFSTFFHIFTEPDDSGPIKSCMYLHRCLEKSI